MKYKKIKYIKKIQFPTSHLEAENPFGLVSSNIARTSEVKKFIKQALKNFWSLCAM